MAGNLKFWEVGAETLGVRAETLGVRAETLGVRANRSEFVPIAIADYYELQIDQASPSPPIA